MAKYLKTKDGRFAGSVGDGATKVPPQVPGRVPTGFFLDSPSQTSSQPDFTDLYQRFHELSSEREATAREGLSQIIIGTYPSASRLIVEESDMVDALNGKPTEVIPVAVLDKDGVALWQQDSLRREVSDFETRISVLAQAVSASRWELTDSKEGLGRRYSLAV